MEINFIILAFLVVIVIFIFAYGFHKKRIHDKIESIGGKVLSIQRRNFFTGLGPFKIVGKGRVVYMIEYKVHTQIKEGWVRFGGLFGPDWRL